MLEGTSSEGVDFADLADLARSISSVSGLPGISMYFARFRTPSIQSAARFLFTQLPHGRSANLVWLTQQDGYSHRTDNGTVDKADMPNLSFSADYPFRKPSTLQFMNNSFIQLYVEGEVKSETASSEEEADGQQNGIRRQYCWNPHSCI
ncbi:hypothetical protein PSACC_03449 [Paramicrosporidium saccamoebae]|uniref:Uncharacterized protein n=1 Tax=Paramicrosporidium saccamoebae TaxID=1246581 RepID=A0A2H9TG73_9FUNG|nr:hypothetical protein PSACC_03449 [Paramicrosporidium saccamoebae]